MVLAEINLA